MEKRVDLKRIFDAPRHRVFEAWTRAEATGPGVEAAAMLKGMKQGWSETVHRLDGHLKKET